MTPLPAAELRELALAVLTKAGTSEPNAAAVADALIRAELDGIASHGLSRLPFYADQAASGKVDGRAVPEVARVAPAAIRVDARAGFAFPAIDAGIAAVRPVAAETAAAVAAQTAADRAAFVRRLGSVDGVTVSPGASANFVLVQVARGALVRERLRDKGFAVRRCDTFPGLGADWLRLAVPEQPQVAEAFVAALRECLTAR